MSIPYGYLAKKIKEGLQADPVSTLVVSTVGLAGYGIYKLIKNKK